MKVTAETRAATRQRILEAAQELFKAKGFDGTSTRDLAQAAKIATGTIFNYFPSKEAIMGCLVAEALKESYAEFEGGHHTGTNFEEDLFALVAIGLRKLKPLRAQLPAFMEIALSPITIRPESAEHDVRVTHLEAVIRLGNQHGYGEFSPVALLIYWSLYVGLLSFWAKDPSPHQEDTLALLDHSLEMFVGWLERCPSDQAAKPT